MSSSPEQDSVRDVRRVGRGALFLSLSKLYFILGSGGIYFAFQAVAPSPEEGARIVGDYKSVGALLTVLSAVLTIGTTQAVSRYAAKGSGNTKALLRVALRVQIPLGIVVSTAFFFGATLLPENYTGLIPAIRVSSVILLVYPIYAALVGVINGKGLYAGQAALDAAFTTLKLSLVLIAIAVFHSAAGGYAGFALAAVLITAIAAIYVRRNALGSDTTGSVPGASELFRFQIQTATFIFLVQWIIQMDLMYIIVWHSFSSDLLDAAKSLYGGMQLFAQLSYSLVIAITFVLFPMISRIDASAPKTEALTAIRHTLRYACILVGCAVTVVSIDPPQLLALLFGKSVTASLDVSFPGQIFALRVLASSFALMAMSFVILRLKCGPLGRS
jgi:O-antigen/teichoic acid export membrane protein